MMARAARRGGDRGFTLIEMLVVLAVIALSAALVAPRLMSPLRAPRPELVLFLEAQRAQAIEKGAQVRVYDSAAGLQSDQTGARFALAKGSKLEMRWPNPSVYQSRQLVAVFYPDGTSIASDFDLVAQGAPGFPDRRLRVRISPMQGDIAYGS